jgi:stage II sporulation protein AA (anti-sigma F factor antagonist)
MSSDFSSEITDGNNPHVKVVHLNGELDEVSIEKLKTYIDPILEDKNVTKLIFDFANLEFINSKGIGYLVSVHTHLAKDGRTLIIAAAVEPVMDVISLVGLVTIIPYYATLDDALNS